MFRFMNPLALFLLVILPLMIAVECRSGNGRRGSIRFSHLGVIRAVESGRGRRSRRMLFILRLTSLFLFMLAMARPQSGLREEEVLTQGIDIVLAIDVSSSMLAEDIKPNRLEAVKEVAGEFIRGRRNDRIGMVIFSGEAYTQCPLTLDYAVLSRFIDEIAVGMIEDGTAIGMGLATAVNRLRNSEAKSKVIVLLTDGRNNRGEIDPVTAAQAAQAFDIRVYTIGAGTRGTARFPVEDPVLGKRYVSVRVDIDEESLTRIAEMTGGRYFRANNRQRLTEIYQEIDAMEKTTIRVREYTRYAELFVYPLILGLLILLAEVVLANTLFRKIP
ncbi:MAG TPA: VWA domain-containing protein [bacterium]|nr:VWA domain-containing protein [bacterium]